MSTEIVEFVNKAELVVKKDYINVLRNNEPKFGVLFVDFIMATVAKRSRRKSDGYADNYMTLVNHINKFCELYGAVIYTNSVNEDFLDDFIIYLESLNNRQSYIRQVIINTKGMARLAGEYGYAVDSSYDEVEVEDEESLKVYLTPHEITRIYYFQGLSKKQQRIRDLFVLGCLTALRYSDYSTLESGNLGDGYITKKTKKTGVKVVVPMHDYVKEIISRYNSNLIFGLSNQYFNRAVKEICKKVGLNEVFTFQYTRGGKVITERKEKWEMISSHTARRSAATGMVLSGYKFYEVMAITGHTTEKSLSRYIGITHEDIAKSMAGGRYFNK